MFNLNIFFGFLFYNEYLTMQKTLEEIFGKEGHDERSLKFLMGALSKGNQEGFDYLEFKESLLNLSKLNLTDEQSVSSAYATASTIGVTADKLVDSAYHYKKLIDKERLKFDQAFQNQINSKIDAKKEEIDCLKQDVQTDEEAIQKLKNKIEKAKETILQAEKEIIEEQERINATKLSFDKTYEQIDSDIQNDIKLIKNLNTNG